MKISKVVLSILIAILIFTVGDFSSAAEFTNYSININNTLTYSQRDFDLDGKGKFFIGKISSSSNSEYILSLEIPGNYGTITYFDDLKNLQIHELVDSVLPKQRLIFISTDKAHFIIGQPYVYKDLGYGTILDIGAQDFSIRKHNGRFIVSYSYALNSEDYGILWALRSDNMLVDFSDSNQLSLWEYYDIDVMARLGFDGYHYKSPSTYFPYYNNSYWRIPSDYLANSLIRTGGSLASDIMGNALLRIAHENINEKGFIPSLPRSQWLYNDYRIDAGFFDTRFNADTIETNVKAYIKFGDSVYRDAYLKLAEYYMNHGKEHKKVNYSIYGAEGWLVDDYYNTGGRPTLTALNHQLQAMHSFYLLYEQERDLSYLEFADKMLQGIKNTVNLWIMPDGNLEYAFMEDGSMGRKDYEYLTYNDLFNVQNDLMRIRGYRDDDLDVLMHYKKIWMDSNGITEYMK